MNKTKNNRLSGKEPAFATYLHQKASAEGIPLSGTFELTARCNFNCKMCYIHQQSPKEKELSAEEWIRIGKEAKKGGMLFLLLTGGEPLLRPDFEEIYVQLIKMGFLISINTNGSLIDEKHIGLFKKYKPCRLNISLYGGREETYQNVCGLTAFEKVTNNIRRLKEAGIPVKLNASITPYNVSDIETIYEFGKKENLHVQATTYMYPPVRINGEQHGIAPARFQSRDAAKYMLFCREQFMDREQICRTAVEWETEEENDCGIITEGSGMRCRAGVCAFWITWDGRMLPCGMFPQEGWSVKESGFESAWESVRTFTAAVRLPGKCKDCSLRNACPSCAASCYAETGSFNQVPEYICTMAKELNRMIIEKYIR